MDKLPFYEVEELLDSLKALNDQEEEERKKSEKSSSAGRASIDQNSMMRKMQANTPKLPNFKL